jgi:hypothetical protein
MRSGRRGRLGNEDEDWAMKMKIGQSMLSNRKKKKERYRTLYQFL